MDDSVIGFATPDDTRTPEILGLMAVEGFAALSEAACTTHGDLFDRAGHNVGGALAGAAARALDDFEIAWSPGAGYVADGLRQRERDQVQIGIALMLLHAAFRGASAEWRIDLPYAVRLPVYDVLLPPATSLAATRIQERTVLTIGHDGVERCAELWPQFAWRAQAAERLTSASGSGAELTLWPDSARIPSIRSGSLGVLTDVVDRCSGRQADAVAAALALLRRVAPAYFRWVSWVMRRILLVKPPSADIQHCATFDWHLGVCLMSETQSPIAIAEMLVHESSHQYFNVARTLGPMVDPSHTTKYYSPFVRCDRPLERILVAYHAFANVLLFFEQCRAAGVATPSRAALEPDVDAVERVLAAQAEHLTPLGRALFMPLYARRSALCAIASRMSS